jgi:acyl-coenzyme A thioesterase PaaI-like protein
LARTQGKKLIAEARCIKPGGNICFFIVNVKDDLDREVAMVTVTGTKVK